MFWNRFDICLAYYVFAMYWHSGQGSATYTVYSVFSRLRYEPRSLADTARQHGERSASCLAHNDDTANARAILAQLVRRHRRNSWEARRKTR